MKGSIPPSAAQVRRTSKRFAITLSVALLAASLNAQATVLLSEGFESGTLGAFTTSGSPGWAASTTRAYSGSYSAHAPDNDVVTDLRLTNENGITIPSNVITARLSFHHWHEFDFYPTSMEPYDGGVLEVSSNGGTTWTDADGLFLSGGYNGTLNGLESNPLGSRPAWVLSSDGWRETVVNLASYAGETVHFRLREGTGLSVGAAGWFVDDIRVQITQPPTLAVTLSPSSIAYRLGKMRTIYASLVPTADYLPLTTQLVSITANEPILASDIQFASYGTSPADVSFNVASKRNTGVTPRIYTVTYRVIDAGDHATNRTATVTVPLVGGMKPASPDDETDAVAGVGALDCSPNPFAASTEIRFLLANGGRVSLGIYDETGRLVSRLVDDQRDPGLYVERWNARGLDGSALPAGTYYARLVTPQESRTILLQLIR